MEILLDNIHSDDNDYMRSFLVLLVRFSQSEVWRVQSLHSDVLLSQKLFSRLERFKFPDVAGLDADVAFLRPLQLYDPDQWEKRSFTHPPSSMSAIFFPDTSCGFQIVKLLNRSAAELVKKIRLTPQSLRCGS